MCWGLHIMEGNKVVREINTTAEAIAFFGAEHVRISNGCAPRPDRDYNYCLCPVDIEHLAARTGYRFIEQDDPRFDSMDNRIEKIT